VDLSGIIFVVLALAWAVFLIPKVLKSHDEAARTRSIDRFSTAIRVLARREPVNDRDSRLVVTPVRSASNRPAGTAPSPGDRSSVPDGPPSGSVSLIVEPAVPSTRVVARRRAARAAARRRRHLLTFLLLCDLAAGVLAYVAVLPGWSPAIPGGLTCAYLVLCRTQVRRESAHDRELLTSLPSSRASGPVERSASASSEAVAAEVEVVEVAVDEHQVAQFAQEDTIGIPVAMLQAALSEGETGGTLWDPLPVTLPTYVTKAKAHRTVRTIDLGEPGTWTSGRTAQDAQIAADAAPKKDAPTGSHEQSQRVVGS
jgi:hypothetical protein